jgi:hypothetical protein
MKRVSKPEPKARRDFLRDAAAAGGAAVVVAAAPTTTMGAETEEQAGPTVKPKGYRLTRHVLDYYKSAAE